MRSGEDNNDKLRASVSVLDPPPPRAVTTSSGDRGLFIIINREGPGFCQLLPGHKKSIHTQYIGTPDKPLSREEATGESIVNIFDCPDLHHNMMMIMTHKLYRSVSSDKSQRAAGQRGLGTGDE